MKKKERSSFVTRFVLQGGRLIAGFSGSDHFKQNLEIELRGKHDTPGLALPGKESCQL